MSLFEGWISNKILEEQKSSLIVSEDVMWVSISSQKHRHKLNGIKTTGINFLTLLETKVQNHSVSRVSS